MSERMPVAARALTANTAATAWTDATARLANPERDRTYWLVTVDPDGRPHLRPLLGLWLDGAFYFITSETARKGQNLARDPRCALGASSTTLPALDIILEGDARKVIAEDTLRDELAAGGPRRLRLRHECADSRTASIRGLCPRAHESLWSPGDRRHGGRRGTRGVLQPHPLAVLGSGPRRFSR